MSRNFKLFFVYVLTLLGFVLFANHSLSNAQSNITAANLTAPSVQPNLTAPSVQPNLSTASRSPSMDNPSTSSSITETVNDVLSGSIDGMIGEAVDMLNSDTVKASDASSKGSLENELPSSLTLDKNNQSAIQDTPLQTRIDSNTTVGVLNNSKIIPTNNQSPSNSVDEIKQSLQKSLYNSSIVQSFDNNSFTKIVNQNSLEQFVYKMKNILDIDLFK